MAKSRRKRIAESDEPSLFPIEDEDTAPLPPSPIERWKIPESWAWTTVGQVGEVKAGVARTPQNRPGLSPTRYLRTANINEDGLDLKDVREMEIDSEYLEIYTLRPGDVVLTESSGSPEHVGKAAIWRGEIPVCCFQNHLLRFRSMGVFSDYALIVFHHYSRNGLLTSLLRGIGINHLGGDNFSQLPFPLPPRKEQERIVAKFSLEAERANNALKSLRAAREKIGLQRQAIVRRELGLSDDEIKTPTGWSKKKIGELCDVINGRAFKSTEWREEGLPIIRIQNLRHKDMPFNFFDGEIEEKHLVEDGDLLFAWSGDSTTSFGAYIWQGEQGALNQHIFKLVPNESLVNREFLFYSINAKLDDYTDAAKGGGNRLHLTRSQFVNSEIAVPPLREQSTIIEAIKKHESTVNDQEAVIEQNISRIETLSKSLLRSAVEGCLVDQDQDEGGARPLIAEYRSNLNRYLKDLEKRRQIAKGNVLASSKSSATQPKKDLVEVLREEGPLLPRELLRKSGYREEHADDIEEFYRLLHIAHRDKRIAHDTKATRDQAKLKAVV